ncbi:glycosyltransferase [Aliivibrio sp. S2TY2]|uniref:glycosyltransferase family 8 protein n=1 Tax=unclassified Aliivibrio TaxID=2645654 RepID=UPI002378E96B|nr:MULTISPECIES: glycosyltransferase [unclassified Aliivibrio]MDD9174936.1 glycosyltransferase [Aliivibrio sp. S3TY1]MDD9192117.1 glycosyltransferase [Aliivibrio sp. S2TY2]
MSKVNIALGFDNGFCRVAASMLSSLKTSVNENILYDVYILHEDISDENQNKITSIFQGASNVNVIFTDVSVVFNSVFKKVYESRQVTRGAYYRIITPLVLKDISKVLYIDPDTVILGDVSLLYLEGNNRKAISGVRDINLSNVEKNRGVYTKELKRKGFNGSLYDYMTTELGLDDNEKVNYINSGVILFDLDIIRNGYIDLLIDNATKYDYLYHDQDIINKTFKDSKNIIDESWNFPSFKFDNKMNVNILHYYCTDKGKPWISMETNGADLYWNAVSTTPYFFENAKSLEVNIIRKNRFSKTLKRKIKSIFK